MGRRLLFAITGKFFLSHVSLRDAIYFAYGASFSIQPGDSNSTNGGQVIAPCDYQRKDYRHSLAV